MNRTWTRVRRAVAASLLAGLALGALTASPGSAVDADQDGAASPLQVDDAQLRWAVNDESNNRAFAPGTFNFLSAGEVPDPGRGGQTMVAGTWRGTDVTAWRARAGDVRVEKYLNGTWDTATFAGLSTTSTGATMRGTNGPFSGHQVVLDGGTGVVDREAGTADISWDGTFSVVFYSGMTFFTVTDPQLRVSSSGATLTAELAGHASSMEDQTEWRAVAPRRVVIADLPTPDLSAAAQADGFTATPRYLGVAHDAPVDGTAQVRSGSAWGSFPTSFVRYIEQLGSGSYWYSSGGSADAHKVAAPVTVSFDVDREVTSPPATTPVTPGDDPTPETTVNPTPPATNGTTGSTGSTNSTGSTGSTGTTATDGSRPVGPLGVGGRAAAALASDAPTTGAAVPTAAPQAAYAAQTTPVSSSRVIGSDHRWTWWLGSVLLLVAAATSVQALHTRRTTPLRGPR